MEQTMIQLATVGGEHLARPSACTTSTERGHLLLHFYTQGRVGNGGFDLLSFLFYRLTRSIVPLGRCELVSF